MNFRPVALFLLLIACMPLSKAAEANGQWLVATDLWGNPAYQQLELPDGDGALTGIFDGDPLTGDLDILPLPFDAGDE